ncbi:MAG TPA: amino acid permease, partial [Acidimicrobiia bacterium]|nr:amino acid permease [Acidimicrobiia bacterium]
ISEEIVDHYGTVISQIGRAAFNGGVGFWILQVFTAGILLLAANTAYQDFPRLSAILARHKLLPRQFRNLGDRLVFSNGVIALATVAVLLIWAFDAQLSRLIQLYVVGVFLSFTLSQTGMVRHWQRVRERGWQRGTIINAVGALTTGVVLIVIASVKFVHGAWIVIVAIPLLIVGMMGIRRHYLNVAARLRVTAEPPPPTTNRVIVLASHTGRATQRAIEYAELIQPEEITVVHVRESRDEDLLDTWDRLYPENPLHLLDDRSGKPFRTLRDFVTREAERHPDAFVTVVIPELVRHRRLGSLITHPHGLVLKLLLLFVPGVVVTDLTYQRPRARRRDALLDPDHISSQLVAVLVADITIPVKRAMVYARMLHPNPLIAAHLNTEDEQRDRLLRSWDPDLGPLQILESPYRGLTKPLLRYVRRLRRDAGDSTLIHIVIPEFVVPGFWSQVLHNQTAFAIKATLIFEPRVAVTSVPWHLSSAYLVPTAEQAEA